MSRALALLAALLFLGTALLAQSAPRPDLSAEAGTDTVVAGPIPEKVTSRSVVVWWHTLTPMESIVVYGDGPGDMISRVQRPWRTTTHEISLRKLQPATTYYFAILQPDGTRSASSQFTTQPVGYAVQSSVRITNGPLFDQITPDSATIAWSSNLPSSFLVRYGTSPRVLDQTASIPWTPTTHRVVLHSLQPDTHYYFTIESSAPPSASSTPSPNLSEQPSTPATPAPIYAFRTLARGHEALKIGLRR
jgi:hypothetical protein